EDRHHTGGQDEADGHAQLWPAAHEATTFLIAPFHGQQDRTAPLTTDSDALDHAQKDQDDRAASPQLSEPGRIPIRAVEIPIISRVTMSMTLRPIRSPQCPKIAAPTGLARNPTK